MKKRSRLEIYFDVLRVIESGKDKPTRIMYGTNLSWITFQEIIGTLSKRGFIELRKKGKYNRYYISDKGIRALSNFRKSIEGLAIIEIHT